MKVYGLTAEEAGFLKRLAKSDVAAGRAVKLSNGKFVAPSYGLKGRLLTYYLTGVNWYLNSAAA